MYSIGTATNHVYTELGVYANKWFSELIDKMQAAIKRIDDLEALYIKDMLSAHTQLTSDILALVIQYI